MFVVRLLKFLLVRTVTLVLWCGIPSALVADDLFLELPEKVAEADLHVLSATGLIGDFTISQPQVTEILVNGQRLPLENTDFEPSYGKHLISLPYDLRTFGDQGMNRVVVRLSDGRVVSKGFVKDTQAPECNWKKLENGYFQLDVGEGEQLEAWRVRAGETVPVAFDISLVKRGRPEAKQDVGYAYRLLLAPQEAPEAVVSVSDESGNARRCDVPGVKRVALNLQPAPRLSSPALLSSGMRGDGIGEPFDIDAYYPTYLSQIPQEVLESKLRHIQESLDALVVGLDAELRRNGVTLPSFTDRRPRVFVVDAYRRLYEWSNEQLVFHSELPERYYRGGSEPIRFSWFGNDYRSIVQGQPRIFDRLMPTLRRRFLKGAHARQIVVIDEIRAGAIGYTVTPGNSVFVSRRSSLGNRTFDRKNFARVVAHELLHSFGFYHAEPFRVPNIMLPRNSDWWYGTTRSQAVQFALRFAGEPVGRAQTDASGYLPGTGLLDIAFGAARQDFSCVGYGTGRDQEVAYSELYGTAGYQGCVNDTAVPIRIPGIGSIEHLNGLTDREFLPEYLCRCVDSRREYRAHLLGHIDDDGKISVESETLEFRADAEGPVYITLFNEQRYQGEEDFSVFDYFSNWPVPIDRHDYLWRIWGAEAEFTSTYVRPGETIKFELHTERPSNLKTTITHVSPEFSTNTLLINNVMAGHAPPIVLIAGPVSKVE